MKGIERTLVIQHMVENAHGLRQEKMVELDRAIREATGIVTPYSTLGKLRRDLGWPSLSVKLVKVGTRVEKPEDTVSYLFTQLNIDLPERLK